MDILSSSAFVKPAGIMIPRAIQARLWLVLRLVHVWVELAVHLSSLSVPVFAHNTTLQFKMPH